MPNVKRGRILDTRIFPELTTCVCGAQPKLIQRAEGLVNVWRVECSCERATGASLSRMHAAVKWEKMNHAVDCNQP